RVRRRLRLSRRQIPVLATAVAFVVGYILLGIVYRAFFSTAVAINLLQDNAFLGVVAIGLTFAILSGGIDLSVGAVVGCTSIAIAVLIAHHNLHPLLAVTIALAGGTLFGLIMGSLIHFFALPPFL